MNRTILHTLYTGDKHQAYKTIIQQHQSHWYAVVNFLYFANAMHQRVFENPLQKKTIWLPQRPQQKQHPDARWHSTTAILQTMLHTHSQTLTTQSQRYRFHTIFCRSATHRIPNTTNTHCTPKPLWPKNQKRQDTNGQSKRHVSPSTWTWHRLCSSVSLWSKRGVTRSRAVWKEHRW